MGEGKGVQGIRRPQVLRVFSHLAYNHYNAPNYEAPTPFIHSFCSGCVGEGIFSVRLYFVSRIMSGLNPDGDLSR